MDEATQNPTDGQHPIDDKVLSLMNARLDAARQLADAASELSTARSRLEAAQRDYAERFKAAEKAGWDRKELTGQLGLEEPEKAPRRRPAAKKSNQQDDSAHSEGKPDA